MNLFRSIVLAAVFIGPAILVGCDRGVETGSEAKPAEVAEAKEVEAGQQEPAEQKEGAAAQPQLDIALGMGLLVSVDKVEGIAEKLGHLPS